MPEIGSDDGLVIEGAFALAYDRLCNSKENLLIMGAAGSGKSTLLKCYKEVLEQKEDANFAIVAPTGVSAIKIGGQTIHSFFKFRPQVTLESVNKLSSSDRKIYEQLEVLVIDEISMVRADLFDCIELFLRKNRNQNLPFGGVRLILVGDLYQLPPIVKKEVKQMFRDRYDSEYFFSADGFEKGNFSYIELDHIFRQDKDKNFLEILHAIRNNDLTDEVLHGLNSRVVKNFERNPEDGYVSLVARNDEAARINSEQLAMLPGIAHNFFAVVEGQVAQSDFPAPECLELKVNAQVMLVHNDPIRRFVNGSIGYVAEIELGDEPTVWVELLDSSYVDVIPVKWEIFSYNYDKEHGRLVHNVVGTYTQLPIILAWAVTVHKSQGKTLDRAIINPKRMFEKGQLYVALSRCRRLEDIVLENPVLPEQVKIDSKVVTFVSSATRGLEIDLSALREQLEHAITCGEPLNIVYCNQKGKVSLRKVWPRELGQFRYGNTEYEGFRAYDETRDEERSFRLDRLIEIKYS